MLLFKQQFLEAIRAGTKTQSIRLWKFRRVRAGQRSYIPGIGYIRILAVDEISLDALTDADALLDGFGSVQDLRDEIQTLYAEQIASGYQAYRLHFELAPQEVKRPSEAKNIRADTVSSNGRTHAD